MFGFSRHERGRDRDGIDVLISRMDNMEFQRMPMFESQIDRIKHDERTNMLIENRMSLLQAKLSSMQGRQEQMQEKQDKYFAAVDAHTDTLDAILTRHVEHGSSTGIARMNMLEQQVAAEGAETPDALIDIASLTGNSQAALPLPSAPPAALMADSSAAATDKAPNSHGSGACITVASRTSD